jgi:hypothetical protein
MVISPSWLLLPAPLLLHLRVLFQPPGFRVSSILAVASAFSCSTIASIVELLL